MASVAEADASSASDATVVADRRRQRRRRAWRVALGVAVALAYVGLALTARPGQRFAHFGDFRLQNGDTISDLVIGYRTAGHLDASRSNAVLVLPWFQGTSAQVAGQIGPGKLVDTSTHFVIMADTLGNGVSSSPATSARQADAAFPRFTIGDMVETQRRLVTETLKLTRLRAVVGTSMGGMQVFEWAVTHPHMLDKAVAIVGSPKSQPDDLERWKEGIQLAQVPVWTRVRAELAAGRLRSALTELRAKPYNRIRQAEAIMAHDISRRFDGSMERAAAALRSELLVVTTWGDRIVNPSPAFEFAKLSAATLLELDGRCEHQAPSCERATLWPALNRFLLTTGR